MLDSCTIMLLFENSCMLMSCQEIINYIMVYVDYDNTQFMQIDVVYVPLGFAKSLALGFAVALAL